MTEAEFWERIQGDPGECWLWDGARHNHGYGEVMVERRKERAHRLAFRLANGSIPPGAHILHECDTPPCCNPAHLKAGNPKMNAEDRERRGRGNQRSPEKISDAQVREVRRRRAGGETCVSIAAELGMNAAYIRRVARGEKRVTAGS
jgi:hypothetical protein